jgi:hypothetical protein
MFSSSFRWNAASTAGDIIGKEVLIGKIVEITVDREESGDLGEFNKILGMIRARIRDQEGVNYFIVETPISKKQEDIRNHADSHQESAFFLVAPRILGDTLGLAFETHNNRLPIGIGRVLDTSVLDSQVFEYSQVEYIAVGYLRFVNPPGNART